MTYQPITGTFLDEITYDIPSQNWGEAEWAREFDTFVESGIDTVILIRAGLGERLACPSRAAAAALPTLPVHQDLVDLYLRLSGERGIAFYLGLYDSNRFWYRHDWRRELEVNRAFIAEMWERYGGAGAFRGWYLPHETPDTRLRIIDLNVALAEEIRRHSELPILVSPYFLGRRDMGEPLSVEEHVRQWDEILSRYQGLVDQCAFQDGTADPLRLREMVEASAELAARYGIELWSNVETFDRDMPIKFPPLDWRKLVHRLDTVQPYVRKLITFEFSHFLSPNSCSESARLLNRRYREHLAGRRQEVAP